MKITTLQFSGIKSQNVNIEPRPVNVITGRNYSGKSAIRNALELAMLGYVPGLGKKNPSIFELSNGEPISVSLAVDGETAITRSWQRNGKSIKADEQGEFDIPTVMLDLGSLFGMSAADRQAYLFRLAGAGELKWESITAAIKNVDVKESTESTETALSNVVELVNSATGENVQERLQQSLALVKEKTKTVNDEVKDHKGFSRTLTRQSDLEIPVNNAKAKMSAARAEVEAAAAEVVKWQNALNDYEAKAAKLKALESEPGADVSELDKSLADLVGKISDAEVNLETLNAKLAEMQPEVVNSNFSELSATVATLTAEYNEIGRRGKELTQQRENAHVRACALLDAKEKDFSEANRKIVNETASLTQKRNEFAAYEMCPTCGTPGETWKDDLLAAYDKNIEEMYAKGNELTERTIASNQEIQDLSRAELAEFDQQIADCAEALEAKLAEGREARKAKDDAATVVESCNAMRQQVTDAQATLNKLNYERQTLTKQRQEIIDQSASHLAAIKNLQEELAIVDFSTLQSGLTEASAIDQSAREKLTEADKDFQRETAAMSKAIEQQESIMRCLVAEAELTILKETTKVLLDIQKTAIENAYEPLLATARKFTDGILKAPLEFHDGDLGYWDKSTFVTHRTFSGTEESLAYAGLMIALASASGAALKIVVLDEMGRFDPEITRPAVVNRMLDLTFDGTIDHAFLIDNDTDYYDQWADSLDVLVHEVTA